VRELIEGGRYDALFVDPAKGADLNRLFAQRDPHGGS
jgi:hypothetical protein